MAGTDGGPKCQGLEEDMKLMCQVLFAVWTNHTQIACTKIYIPTLLDSFALAAVSPGVSIASHNCVFCFVSLSVYMDGDNVSRGPCFFLQIDQGFFPPQKKRKRSEFFFHIYCFPKVIHISFLPHIKSAGWKKTGTKEGPLPTNETPL